MKNEAAVKVAGEKESWNQFLNKFESHEEKCAFHFYKGGNYFLCRSLIILALFSGSSVKGGWKR